MRRALRTTTALITAGALALSGALASCSSSSADRSGVLRVWAGESTPFNDNFNPFSPDAVFATFGAIYEPLFFYNQLSSDPPTGMIGQSFEINGDGTVITVKIKPDLQWSDGQPLTADDVAFTFGYGPNKSPQMVSATAPDATTVVLTYNAPQFTAESLILGSTTIIPKHVWSSITDYASQTNEKPVGSGPYVLDSFSDAAYTIKANPKFRDGEPAVKEVQYLALDANQSGQDLLTTDKLDWSGQFIANPDSVTAGGRIGTANFQQDPTVIMACSNADLGCKGPQTDPAVRQAINLLLDRDEIAKKAFAGLTAKGNPAFLLLPRDQQWLADPATGESPQSPNIAAAQKVLEDAGYAKGSDGIYAKDGVPLDMTIVSPDGWTDYNDADKLISEQAAAAGIRIEARTVSDAEYYTPASTGDYQLMLWGLTQSLVADPYSNYHEYFASSGTAEVGTAPPSGQNFARYSNPEVDAAVTAAAATQDVAAKQAAYATVQQHIAADLPYIPVVVNASQAFFDTKDFTGWPSVEDPYADPLPYLSTASGVVLAHLKPVQK
ncbi:peptide/nickel transport system substrate-binding protein [Quadrisphaera granulorum]|uniref:Peptide/nickel transport system substrate-binding protein n=1 Tax=Quadrisphaera granulorum TaxID=317664 RepID=A0A316A9B1_9ACTN|nr:ABC transporter substrate-binding protein [Quadrisphaera granulorum]PWJ54009.1 peptide/nickel transport system substrate-binding protein [Quadrisphaera granulorum]SZE96466.1 peptide/nickel transport system substrate-binding protein [Quadrisphaera granulorum]